MSRLCCQASVLYISDSIGVAGALLALLAVGVNGNGKTPCNRDRFVNSSTNLMNPTTYENSTQALPAPSFVSFTWEAPIFLLTEAASV